MAKHSARQIVQKVLCENPKIKEIVSEKLLNQLMNAVKIEAVMGETIVSLEPTMESPCLKLDAVSFTRSVRLTPLVRCRKCKYRAEDYFCTGRGWPMQLVADDGFCEKGKRKDGGQDND